MPGYAFGTPPTAGPVSDDGCELVGNFLRLLRHDTSCHKWWVGVTEQISHHADGMCMVEDIPAKTHLFDRNL